MDLKSFLNTIPEEISSSESDDEKKIIEIIYFSTKVPALRSYYIVNSKEYGEILNLQKDIFIDNFLNNECLTSNNLDIHIIKKKENIILINNFLKIFGNPFDILEYINSFEKPIFLNNENFTDSDKLVSTFNHFNLSLSSMSSSDEINVEEITNITEVIDEYNKQGKIISSISNINMKDKIINELKDNISK